MKACRGVRGIVALDGGGWLTYVSAALGWGKSPSTHGSWLGCRMGMYVSEKGNISSLLPRLQVECSGLYCTRVRGFFSCPNSHPLSLLFGGYQHYSSRGRKVTIDLHLWPKLILSGAMPSFLYTPLWCVQR